MKNAKLTGALLACLMGACASSNSTGEESTDSPAEGRDGAVSADRPDSSAPAREDAATRDGSRPAEPNDGDDGSDEADDGPVDADVDGGTDDRDSALGGGDGNDGSNMQPLENDVGSQWVIGFYAAYQRDQLAPANIDWSGVSHLVMTRLKTDGGGRVQRDMDVDDVNGPALARDIAQRAHQNGRKALLLVGGAGQGAQFRDSASNANRANFVKNLLTAMNDLGFDGLDLDWEESVDYDLWTQLAKDLRASNLAPAGLILTGDVFPVNGNYQSVDPKIATLSQQLDRLNIMSYYPGTAYTGSGWQSWHGSALTGLKPTTPVTIEDTLSRYATAGVAKSKLAMGVAFYAMCYTGGVTAPNQSTEGGVEIRGGDNDYPLSRLFANGGPYSASARKWDAAARVPYLSLQTPESHGCRYVSFDDEESLEAKGAFSKSNGYGGIIVWTLNQGWLTNSSKAPNALTQALKRGFLD